MTENVTGKAKILESALVEFADKSYDGARVDRIAIEAGVNKALIYYHFKSKEELYVASINYLFAKAAPKEMQLPTSLTVREKMLLLIRHFTTFLHHNPQFIKIMDQAVYKSNAIFDKLYEQNLFFQMSMALYLEGVAKKEIREVEEPVDYLVSLLGACYFFYSHRSAISKFYERALDEKEFLEMRIRTVEDIVSRVFFQN
ncbi:MULTISPECIES: TetR/AcrR family transcriptional regulator [unclassified Bacillus (in: firmicutes)]|uniref:TetR/AcrR family transcriptional regulator n=1 Tax=unclassified Bacillus (in: firmicutes) TaxID=185979 RepID=UPI0008E153CC|nr:MULTISPECIES: TetR/AcrR family transcriptional regulator [unclassified Bacillus (in: firmicutes)]SFA90047.1 DNA-binding transcriptional regulator, AcrR family [Bacillus sp. UNCCL13]SFQ85124.1 DNA-binding transcriptional regulator, AcrR family [Bacillus sp. cl95]